MNFSDICNIKLFHISVRYSSFQNPANNRKYIQKLSRSLDSPFARHIAMKPSDLCASRSPLLFFRKCRCSSNPRSFFTPGPTLKNWSVFAAHVWQRGLIRLRWWIVHERITIRNKLGVATPLLRDDDRRICSGKNTGLGLRRIDSNRISFHEYT